VVKACPWFSICGVSSCCCKAQKEQRQWGEELPIVVLLADIGTCNKRKVEKEEEKKNEKKRKKRKKKRKKKRQAGKSVELHFAIATCVQVF
jgi:hypothetical protein